MRDSIGRKCNRRSGIRGKRNRSDFLLSEITYKPAEQYCKFKNGLYLQISVVNTTRCCNKRRHERTNRIFEGRTIFFFFCRNDKKKG